MQWIARWWPVLFWALLISFFSTRVFTAENTGRFILPVLHWLLPHASPEKLATIHFLIRKCAHFTEYFVFSLLILRSFREGRTETRFAWIALTVLIVAAYASLDEFHQSFVPGRTPAVRDVLIDTAGGIAAQVAAALATRKETNRHKARNHRG